MLTGADVYGATLGIVGAGRIGASVARRARGFNMKLLYYDVVPNRDMEEQLGAKRVDLEVLLKESDFVTVHVPLIDSTRHLMNEGRLGLMKKTAFLINNSRGPVVDEKALYEALREGKIAGAALDVFEQEPTPKANPLLELENVIAAPHISSASHETRSRMASMVAENLVEFFSGRMPPNLLNPEATKVRPLRRLFQQ